MQYTDIDRQTAAVKVPPQSLEAEQAVLGGLMLENDAWDKVSEELIDSDFYRHEHQLIFRAMGGIVEKNQPLDVITLSEALDKVGDLEAVGGLSYLGELARNTPTASNIRAYAEIIRERSILRKLVTVAGEIADDAFETGGRDSTEILDDAERKVFQIAEDRPNSSGPKPINPVITKAIEKIDELYQSDSSITGLSTGFTDLDKMTAGLQPSDLIIVAGRPSMGKTTFSMNLVEHAVISNDQPVVVFSMEMPADSLVTRMLSSLGRIDQTKIRTGQLDDDDWPRLTSAVSLLKDRPLFIDDDAALSPTEVRSRARRIAREHGQLGLIMIDYLQLMQVKGGSENRTGEISEISRSLKALAKELNVPVIALSQLNRSLEQRSDRRPVMSDLRESGAIEQDADVIAFIYRDEVYNEESPDKGVAEIIIGKQRNGPIGKCRLAFVGKYTKFEDLAHGSYEDFE
ncbi:Replicative DNA helicase [gamma proteobacterium IMCC2047]|nr:Replicative DNA helicase [gamma proteobacterium IMCC2047]